MAKKPGKIKVIIKKIDEIVGHWAFIVGVSLAFILAIKDPTKLLLSWGIVLIVFGIIIGILNITKEETELFLIASVALIIANTAHIEIVRLWNIGLYLQAIIKNLVVLFTPAAVIVALEAIYSLAKKR